MQRTVDLNCDLGESFGAWSLGQDEAILPLVSSASIACGFHAGDPIVMQHTVLLAQKHGVAIGAHLGLPDLQGFGRREMAVTAEEVYALALYQMGALSAFTTAAGTALRFVKPHGALYNMAARDPRLALAIARAVRDFDRSLLLFGLSGSELVAAGKAVGLGVVNEAFADRRYETDGSLTPRRETGAVIDSAAKATAQVLELLTQGRVRSRQGEWVAVAADTVCLHGDRPDIKSFATTLREHLDKAGVLICHPGAISSAGLDRER
jgi:UPF0271 protein